MHMLMLHFDDFDAAIFDMDGTMIQNMSYHQRAWKEFAKRHGIVLTDQEFHETFSGRKNDSIFSILFGRNLSSEEIERYTQEKESLYRELYAPAIREVSGLTAVITTLLAHHKGLAVATTAPKGNRDFGLTALHLTDVFSVVLGDEHVTKGKPDPEIYLETAKQLHVTPQRCLVFEDTPSGIAAGKRAGMTVVGLLTTHEADDLSEADYVIQDFTRIQFS